MANFDPYKAGEDERKQRIASMLAPNAYTAKTKSEQANIDRRAKMIELLQGQANAPIERFGYGGIEAYTPPTAYLAKILSGAMAGYQSGKAGQEQAALDKYKEQAQTQDMNTMIEMMNKGTGKTNVSSIYDTSFIKDPAKRAEQDAYLSAPTTSMSQSQPPSYTGGALNMTMPTAQPSAPVTDIQERRYSMRTPEGQMELLRQTASDKQAMAKLLLDQRNREDEAQKAVILETGRNERARLNREATIAAKQEAFNNRPLPTPLSNKIDTQATTYINTKNLIDTFSDSYGDQDPGGAGYGGDFLVTMKGRFGENNPTYQWWKTQKTRDALVRNNLFGASLTPGEQASWSELTVNPNMSAATIKGNLLGQAEIERKALLRQSNALIASKYNPEVIEAYLGDTVENLGISLMPKTAKPEDPAGTKTNENASTNATIPTLKDNPSIDDIVELYKSKKT
jgi:hypothetical protein